MRAVLTLLSFLVALVAVRVLISRFGRFALDVPNARSLHERPVPRTGGIAVLLGGSTAFAFGAAPLWVPAALALALAAVSLADDLHRLPTAARLAAHLGAAGFLVWYMLSPMHPVEMAVLVIAVTWVTNLYNFMDGSDGLAGGMATIGFAAYALAAWRRCALRCRPRRLLFCCIICIPRAYSSVISARFRSAFLPVRSALRVGATMSGRFGFRCWCSGRSSGTRP
jgi:UDP-N-acetylmuramyl pentapeptide phosphotransferase/UDP-N-acetylglucosamine-1-phosphate transferase